MLLFAWYLLKVSVCSGLLYGYYLLALRNKKFHQYNRFYLLTTVLLSLVLPLLKIEIPLAYKSQSGAVKLLSVLNSTGVYIKTITTQQQFLSYLNQLITYIFPVVTVVAFFTLILRLWHIFLLIRDNPKKTWKNIHFVFTKSHGTPFSFFRYIFLNENIDIDSDEGNRILQHELTHIKQNHTIDKLFLNFVLTIYWINPFFWIIRKELAMIHEFLADEKAISSGDTNAFAAMLLTAAFPRHFHALTNSFFHSPIKRRLLMITSSKTTRFSIMRRLSVLPLLSFISVLPEFKIEAKDKEKLQTLYTNEKGIQHAENPDGAKENFADTTEAKFPGGNEAWKKFLETNLNANVATKDKARAGIYTVKLEFTVTESGEIENILATKIPDHCPSCAIEAVRVIKTGPKWEPMTIDGKKVMCKQVQFISFSVEGK